MDEFGFCIGFVFSFLDCSGLDLSSFLSKRKKGSGIAKKARAAALASVCKPPQLPLIFFHLNCGKSDARHKNVLTFSTGFDQKRGLTEGRLQFRDNLRSPNKLSDHVE